ncbi:prolactin regulatory element-binding protein [Trichonephila inaurata madagascariensis]|uniref:Prolactin regulatory element-binding protein n=1 Tax=Trichonephila inaurata madagascariensis TaxID=2747483 RepID=A0A8X6IYG7_9ARAC|nr:prolactin regulatory element-binding protein [Trichonephila inaurata madagascariensis]GFY47130.1 prolactin regulatory element-binding protein [Trichonephila inaurata madagascariensis]
MFSKKQNQLLARVNFPIYTVHSITERHILIAGGGGGAKTGIPNVIEIYELINNGSTCRAESVTHFETGSEAIMNCTVHDAGKYFLLFAGMEGNCHVYKIKHSISDEGIEIKEKKPEKQNKVIQRKKKSVPDEKGSDSNHSNSDLNCEQPDANANVIHSRLCFEIKHLESFQTDFSKDPYQKLVRFSSVANLLATAGADGHIRIWKHPKLNKIFDIEAHTDDVDDLDICPLGKRMVSISRDGHGKVWNLEDGLLLSEIKYVLPSKCSNVKYTFRSCRFGIVEDKNDLALFATLNPARTKPPSQCFICKWDTKHYAQQKLVSAGTDLFSAMAVSDDGHFIGLGTQSGSVKIYIAFSLQQIYNVDYVHGIFVTGLEFLPSREESRRITGGHETSLISISVDNHVIIHHIPMRPSMGILSLICLFILTLFTIFVIMDYFNL